MLLIETNSPYAYRDVQATDEDLLTAVQICSRTFAEGCDFLAGDMNARRLMCWARRWSKYGLATAHASFRTYLDDYQRVPLREDSEDANPSLKASPYWHLVRVLCSTYGFKFREAWDCPKSVAICAADVWSEAQGGKGLVSDAEERVIDTVNRGRAAMDQGNAEAARELFAQAQRMADAARRG